MTTQANEGMVPAWTMGDRLRKARLHNGWTVAEFARLALCSEKTVNNYEADKVRPRALLVSKWADVTRVPLEWLETGQVASDDNGPDDDGVLSRTRGYAGNLRLSAAA